MSILKLDSKKREMQKHLYLEVQSRSQDEHNQHTPLELCEEIVEKLVESDADFSGNILIISTVEFIPVMLRVLTDKGLSKDKIWFSSWNEYKRNFAEKLGINTFGHLLDQEIDMKFDVIVGNPPYQNATEGSFYCNFLSLALKLTHEKSHILLINPGQWLSKTDGKLNEFKKNIINHGIEFLKFYSKEDAAKQFSWPLIIGGITYFHLNRKSLKKSVTVENFSTKEIFEIDIDWLKNNNDFFPVNKTNFSLIQEILKIVSDLPTMDLIHNRGKIGSKQVKTLPEGENLCILSKGRSKYIAAQNIAHIDAYKIIYNYSNGYDLISTGIKKFLAPGEIVSESFLYFTGNSLAECQSIDSYIKSVPFKFFKKMMTIDHNATSKTFSKVPIIPFDRIWTDETILNYLNISMPEHVEFIYSFVNNLK